MARKRKKTAKRAGPAAPLPPGFRPDPALPRLRVAVVHSPTGLVAADAIDALRALGHRVMPIAYRRRGGSLIFPEAGDDLGLLARRVRDFAPQVILACNVEGLGYSGIFPALAETLGAALAAWLVDHPPRDIDAVIPPDLARAILFSYDRAHADDLARRGYPHALHLPLATMPARFDPPGASRPQPPIAIGYAGNLFAEQVDEARRDILSRVAMVSDISAAFVEDMAREGIAYFADPTADSESPWAWVADRLAREKPDLADALEGPLAALIAHAASARRRLHLARVVDQGDLHVWGRGWKDAVAPERCHAPVPYDRLHSVYRSCRVNLAVPHAQSVDSVTQRAFDVPAAGGFVLGQWRPSVADLFDVGEELAVYRSDEEARDLAAHYAADCESARQIAQKARKRVLAEHTYAHRLTTLLAAILERWPEVAAERSDQRRKVFASPPEVAAPLVTRLGYLYAESAAKPPETETPGALLQSLPGSEPWGLAMRARGAAAQGECDEALGAFARLIDEAPESDPRHPGNSDFVVYEAARARAQARGYGDALPWFRRAARLSPRNAHYWTALAAAFLEAGDDARGRGALERALALDPANPLAQNLGAAFRDRIAATPPNMDIL